MLSLSIMTARVEGMRTSTRTNIHFRGEGNLRFVIDRVNICDNPDPSDPVVISVMESDFSPFVTLFINDAMTLHSVIRSMESIIERVKNDPRLSLPIMTAKVEA